MAFLSCLPCKPDPKKLISQANKYLKNARKKIDSNKTKALKLTTKAEAKIQTADSISLPLKVEGLTSNSGIAHDIVYCIANAYHEHGDILDMLGYSTPAEKSHEKAREWGYGHVVGGHTNSSPPDDNNGPSTQSGSSTQSSNQNDSPTQSSNRSNSPTQSSNQSASPTQSSNHNDSPTGEIGHIPRNIFNKDTSLTTIKDKLPGINGRVTSVRQLVYCLKLFSVSSEELDVNERNWTQKVDQDPIEKGRIQGMATNLVRAFAVDELKNQDEVYEVVWLAPILNQECFRNLLHILVDGINSSILLKVNMVDGLVRLMRNSGPRVFDTDDLVKILDLLSSRLEKTHDQSNQLIYKMTLAVSAVLDSMADNNVVGLSREQLHEPLFKYLQSLLDRPEPYLMYQAAYTFQALQYVPNNESRSQAVQRNGMNLLQGVIGVATGANGMNIGTVIEGLKKIHDTASEIARPFIFNVRANIESGQSLMSNLKDGFRYRRDWYPALRAIDISLRNGRLSEVKKLVNQAPGYLDPAFQLGLCQRLGELAINPLWDTDSRQDSIDLLVEMYKDDAKWGQHIAVKKWILHTIHQLKESSDNPISEKANTSFLYLETDDGAKKQDVYLEYKQGSPHPYPLMIPLPPMTSRLFDQIPSKPGLSETLKKLILDRREENLKEGREKLYIPPRAKRNLNAKEDFDLRSDLQKFLESDKKVFLLLGDSGSGKSTFNRAFEIDLWRSFEKEGKRIPLFINLPSVKNPEEDLVLNQLHSLYFTKDQIQKLREDYEFILICDAYDETQLKTNLYMNNKLNQAGGWRAQMVISCRIGYSDENYGDIFEPIDRNKSGTSNLFQEAVIVPFNNDQIQSYVEQYVSVNKSTEAAWRTSDYDQVLKQIPTLQDLVKNPFLLKLATEVLPKLVDPKKSDLESQKVTRIALYDAFVKQWLERSRKRLAESRWRMSSADSEEFDKLRQSRFIRRGFDFIRDLAKAICIENDFKPVFSYSGQSSQNSWQASFFSREGGNYFLQQSIPLTSNNDQYRFIHKSILEYGLTLSVFEPPETLFVTPKTLERSQTASTLPRWGCTSYVQCLDMETLKDKSVSPIEQSLIDSPFGKKSFVSEPSILQFLVERIQQDETALRKLVAVLERSKTDSSASTAAANAITVMVRAGIDFNGADLRGIRIPGANLGFGVFDSTQLEGADLQKVNLRNIWLRKANLNRAQMEGVQFGEPLFLQENSDVRCCAYSPDGGTFAAGLMNGTISLYETTSWNRTKILVDHKKAVTSLSFSTTNKQIASGSEDKTVRLWDVDTGKCVHVLEGHSKGVTSAVYSPNGDRIVSGSYDGTARLWDVETGKSIRTLDAYSECVWGVMYSPKGDRIAFGQSDKTVRLWSVKNGRHIDTSGDHTASVASVVYSPNGDRIASGSLDRTVRLWDVVTGKCVKTLTGHLNHVRNVAYSPKGNMIASGSDDEIVRLWDVDTGKCVHVLQGHSSKIYSVVYSPKGDRIVSESDDLTVRLWDVDTGKCVQTLQGYRGWGANVVYSPKGDQIASGSANMAVRLWDVDNGDVDQTMQGHSDCVTSVVYSRDGYMIVSGSADKTVRLWDVDSSKCVQTFRDHGEMVTTVACSPKEDQVASGGLDRTVRLWNVKTGKCVRTLKGHNIRVSSVAYSSDGARIATGSWDKTVRVWDVLTGDCLYMFKGHSRRVYSVAYSPKKDRIASGSEDKSVRVWDVNSSQSVCILEDHSESVTSVMYSPNGDQLASGSKDSTVRLWDIDTGICVQILQGHDDGIASVVYSPNGDWIASGSDDKTVKVWDIETGNCLTTISDFNGTVCSLAFTESYAGLFLVTGSDDKSVRHWEITNKGNEYNSALRWSTSHETLTVTDASFEDVKGLSRLNRKLLVQRKALISEPLTEI